MEQTRAEISTQQILLTKLFSACEKSITWKGIKSSHGRNFKHSHKWQWIWPMKYRQKPGLRVGKTWDNTSRSQLAGRAGLKDDPGRFNFERDCSTQHCRFEATHRIVVLLPVEEQTNTGDTGVKRMNKRWKWLPLHEMSSSHTIHLSVCLACWQTQHHSAKLS